MEQAINQLAAKLHGDKEHAKSLIERAGGPGKCLAPPKWRGGDGRCNSCLVCKP